MARCDIVGITLNGALYKVVKRSQLVFKASSVLSLLYGFMSCPYQVMLEAL